MKQLSDIYSYLITWDQIDEPKLFSVSRFCGHFVVYSCVGSFLFLFCCFSHSPFLLGRNALCFQRFHFTNWSLPPTPCPVLLPLGRAATGQAGGGCHLREPNADSCLLAGILAVYRKPISCFGLRDMGDKPVLVAPKNPLVRMRSNPGIPWALLGLWLCSSCSIPPNPASNKSALPLPS